MTTIRPIRRLLLAVLAALGPVAPAAAQNVGTYGRAPRPANGTDPGAVDLPVEQKALGKPLPLEPGLRYLEQACSGLHLAHERGVVHRDIKPHNLFVTKSGEVKVMDFGIARKMNTPGVTMVGTIAGTPEYMSPEQINGFSDVTFSTDLYALGVTAYQMFTGTLPFEHPELMRLLIAQATEAPPRPRARNPEIPEVLEQVLLKLLEKKPADRPSSAGELGAMLRGIRISLKEAQGG